MIKIEKYTPDKKNEWDNLIDNSKNGTFIHKRDFMEYHADRFEDLSFIIYRKNKIEGVIPGNINEVNYYSHQGLTYGGLIYTTNLTVSDVLKVFLLVIELLKKNNVIKWIYKPVPRIYHTYPCEEDLYALFRNNGQKIGCNISSAIKIENKIKFNKDRINGAKKGIKNQLSISNENCFKSFWTILEENLLSKYEASPIHTLNEIQLLAEKFKENIKLYIAKDPDENIAGGIVLFINKKTVHTQYISINKLDKKSGAIDYLIDYLLNNIFSDYEIFDFGTSNEMNGEYLNENLIYQKEAFGGRGIVYDTFEILLN